MGVHRKAEPGAKVAMGSVTLSSYKSNLTINHGLGIKPTTVFIVSHGLVTEYVAGGLISDKIKEDSVESHLEGENAESDRLLSAIM